MMRFSIQSRRRCPWAIHESPLHLPRVIVLILVWILITLPGNLPAQESKKDQTSLELPDVIIYGAEKDFREAGEKLSLLDARGPSVPVSGVDPYQSFPPTADSLSLPSLQKALSALSTSLAVYGGPYSSWGIRAAHNSRLKKADLRLFADLEGTEGEYTNSGGTWGEIEGRIKGPLSNTDTAELQAGYRRWSYGIYDWYNLKGKARQETFSVMSSLQRKHSDRMSSRVSFRFQRLRYSNPSNSRDRLEDQYQGEISGWNDLGSINLASSVHWTGIKPSWENGSAAPKNDLFGLRIAARIPFVSRMSATIGGDLQLFSWGDRKDQVRFFPRLNCIYRHSTQLAIHASVEGGFQPYSLMELTKENPHSSLSIMSSAEEVRWKLETGVEVEVRPDILLRGSYHWTQVRDDMFWRWTINADSDRYFNYTLDEVRCHQVDISGEYAPVPEVTVEAGFSHMEYDIEDDLFMVGDPSTEIPFHPNNRAWGVVNCRIPNIIVIRGDWQWIGKRAYNLPLAYESYYDPEKLDDYLLMNLMLEKEMTRNVTVFTGFYNIFDSDYEVWYGYPEMSFTVRGGAKVVF